MSALFGVNNPELLPLSLSYYIRVKLLCKKRSYFFLCFAKLIHTDIKLINADKG